MYMYFSLTLSISVKLVLELRRMNWSRALKACVVVVDFFVSFSMLVPLLPLFGVVARDRSDFERILDCTNVLKVLKPVPAPWLPPKWWLEGFSAWPIDFFREAVVDILEVRLTLVWSDDKSLPSFFWSEEAVAERPPPPLQVVTSILGNGRELLRLRGGWSVVNKPHVIPFNLHHCQISFVKKRFW